MTGAEVFDLIVLLITIFLVVNIVLSVVTLLLERRDAASLWAWILVMTFIPVLGFLLYVFVGRRLSREKIFRLLEVESGERPEQVVHRQRQQMVDGEFVYGNPTAARYSDLAVLLADDDGGRLTQDNRVQIFDDGNAKFDSLVADIAQATDHVHLLYYIFRPDELGTRILDALAERAEAGVEVRLCVDAMGGKRLRRKQLARLRAAGGLVYQFFPNVLPLINFRINNRTHRKIAVIDGRIGYVGGFNIGDEYLGKDPKFGYWRDTHLRIVGGAVASLQKRLLMDWNVAASREDHVHWEDRYFPDGHRSGESATDHVHGDVVVQIASSGPDGEWERIKYGYLKLFALARKSIYIQTPYFMPDAAVMDALKVAARSGIDVRLMVPDKPDHLLVYPATLSFADELAEAGAKVFIYRNGFMHAKTVLIDEVVGSVGSANIDYRSFRLNFEANAFVYDADIGRELAEIYRRDLTHCTEFDHDTAYRHPFIGRVKESVSRLVSPLL